jgi:methylglyoxal synthase
VVDMATVAVAAVVVDSTKDGNPNLNNLKIGVSKMAPIFFCLICTHFYLSQRYGLCLYSSSRSNGNKMKKQIALIAHDNKKDDLIEWVDQNKGKLNQFELFATGTTGKLIEEKIQQKVNQLQSGPLGGDQQIGALITEGKIDVLVFFWDPLQPMPHDPDVKALLRIAVVWNIPMACNRTTADFILTSSLLFEKQDRISPKFEEYQKTQIETSTPDRK